MADLAGGRAPVAEAGDHQADRFTPEGGAVDAHRGKARVRHQRAGQIIETDDRKILRNAPADLADRLEHADRYEIVHAEGGGEPRTLREGCKRCRMCLLAGATLKGKV